MPRAVFQFLDAEFVYSIDIRAPQWCGNGFWTGREPKSENIKYKLVIESNRWFGGSPQRLEIWGIYWKNNPFLGMFQLKF